MDGKEVQNKPKGSPAKSHKIKTIEEIALEREIDEGTCPECHKKKTPLKRLLGTYQGIEYWSWPMFVCENKVCGLKQSINNIGAWKRNFPLFNPEIVSTKGANRIRNFGRK